MSWLSDLGKFEGFVAKDMWGKVKDDPERLLLGAVDPLSSKMWGEVTGKDYEPLVDQMGGAYGGDWISAFGNGQDGGVYGRAKAAGIDTGAGKNTHDFAHVLSAIFGGQGLYGAGQNALGGIGSGGGNLGVFSNGGTGGMSQVGNGMAGMTPNIQGGAGAMGNGMLGMNPMMGGMPGGQQEQQQPMQTMPIGMQQDPRLRPRRTRSGMIYG